jgi:hypothetical protein
MANRYQDRSFRAVDDYDHGEDHASAKGESDPLAELARLIGQTDPFGTMGRANQQVPPRPSARDQYQRPAEPDNVPPAGPPPWMQRANRQEIPQQELPPEYSDASHPLQRHAARAEPEPDYHEAPPAPFEDEHRELDPSRYDDALYGQLDAGGRQALHDPAYADDAYGYSDGYDDGIEDQDQKRRGGLATVIVVLALAVVGTGAAFAYRTFVGSPRSSGEPPIIRADTSPTKIVPSPADGTAKLPDRLASGDGSEKIVPREEAPVDVNATTGPRVVFPPLNQNSNPPPPSSVAPGGSVLASAGNGTLPNSEPRKIKTLTVRGDQSDGAAVPANSAPPPAKPAPAARTTAAPSPAATRSPASAANANASAPLSLVPGTQPDAEPRSRMASNNPAQSAPAGAAGGGYLVQVSSQRNEADAQASYRALQGKFPGVLGSHEPVIRRADLGEKGVYYRAMVGPFGTSEEAVQLCGNLKSAGGQCVVQRN